MRFSFVAGIILGLTLTFGLAGFYPWVDHARSASLTTVSHNGGRLEEFVIRFPVDRIATVGSPEMGLRARAFPEEVVLPADLAGPPVLVEHFKVRNVEGDVIGVAARHASAAGEEPATAWALTIPGRGTMHLLGSSEPGRLDRELSAAGHVPGQPWSGEASMTLGSPESGSGRVSGGGDEFSNLVGTYIEGWSISGVSQSGELRGTITLSTSSEIGE